MYLKIFDGIWVPSCMHSLFDRLGIKVANAAKKRPGEDGDGENGPPKKRKPKAKAKGKAKAKSKGKGNKDIPDDEHVDSKTDPGKEEEVEPKVEVPNPSASLPDLPPPRDADERYADLWKEKEWAWGVQIVR